MANISDIQMMKNLTEKFKNKSDDEIVEEIKKLKGVMSTDDDKLKQQIKNIIPFREMLSEEQKKKFDLVVKALTE